MAFRGKLLANLSLAKSRPNQEEGFLSKCNRFLASLPSRDKTARKKLNFLSTSAQSCENTPDQSSKALDPPKISPPSGMCLMWKTGQISSGSDIGWKESSDNISGGDMVENEAKDDNENDQLGNPRSEGDPAPQTMCAGESIQVNDAEYNTEDIDGNENNLFRDYGEDIDGNDNNLMRDYGEEERYDIQDKENRYVDLNKKKTVRFERKTGKKSARAIQQSFKNGFVTLKKRLRDQQK